MRIAVCFASLLLSSCGPKSVVEKREVSLEYACANGLEFACDPDLEGEFKCYEYGRGYLFCK